jgi:histidinol-phosphate aminotransferase
MAGLKPNPGILNIAPYVGGESAVAGSKKKAIKLSSNEGAFGPSPKAIAAYKKNAAEIHRYPDGHCVELRKTIGKAHGLDPAQIVCGAGSDELLSLVARAYAGPGDEVLYTTHGFLIYPIAAMSVGATPVVAPETDYRTDVDALLERVNRKTRIVFIANPNNPTGSYIDSDELARLHAGLPKTCLLVIDAAYAEYVNRNDYSVGFELVDKAENVVVTRTFSKMYGMGGMRLGWGYFPPVIADVMHRLRLPFNVSNAAQAAGIAALNDRPFTAKVRANNDKWLPWTTERLQELGLEVLPSAANFVLVRFPKTKGRDSAAADTFLKSRGLIARRVESYKLPDCLRVTIGKPAEMKAFIAAMTDFRKDR